MVPGRREALLSSASLPVLAAGVLGCFDSVKQKGRYENEAPALCFNHYYYICPLPLSYLPFSYIIFVLHFCRIFPSLMLYSAVIEWGWVGCGELCRSRRMLSTSAFNAGAWIISSEMLSFTYVIFVFHLCHICPSIMLYLSFTYVICARHLCRMCSSFMPYLCFSTSFMSSFVLHLWHISPY